MTSSGFSATVGSHMKLISKYRDYYDFFARNRTISDHTYVWERKPMAVPVGFAVPRIVRGGSRYISKRTDWQREIELTGFLVWFCGIPVPVARVSSCNPPLYDRTERFFYVIEDIPEAAYGGKPKCRDTRYPSTYERLEKFFALGEDVVGWRRPFESIAHAGRVLPRLDVMAMHRAVHSPVFCHTQAIGEFKDIEDESLGGEEKGISFLKPGVLVNPRLAAIEFWRRFDAFTAFQMLERFLANDLAPTDARMDRPIPDRLKAQSHGFDKMSFRKEPSRKRIRR